MHNLRPSRVPRLWLIPVLALCAVALAALTTGSSGSGTAVLALMAVVAAAATGVTTWTVLRARRQREEYEQRLAAWAGERAVQEERIRIARDLHDLVSHGLGTVTVRAAAAVRATGPAGPGERVTALADIEEVSRRTTTELRRMLTVLRSTDPETAPVRPAETLESLPGIVRAARDQGLTVTLDLSELGSVSPGVQLTLCAVVREALNNTARHAGPTTVRVGVRRAEDRAILVSVADEGPATDWEPRPGAGYGLIGLRERVRALGGTLDTTGPGAEGAPGSGSDDTSFVLTARIPDREAP
ncbi:sensor histidine kinase [Nocardiopsis metallicus]|uniref:histidine kinase n=1 Tax=Nocardiopsis metallicus TaxID=179819 RepID=A0A840VZU6_9ACTN|nr:histidine kinase [Nocardiopsis metallicus]MBB5489999.1 signal transduction histidine kinase [Nocardiopsis metallicus]